MKGSSPFRYKVTFKDVHARGTCFFKTPALNGEKGKHSMHVLTHPVPVSSVTRSGSITNASTSELDRTCDFLKQAQLSMPGGHSDG